MQPETKLTLLEHLRNGADSLAWREFSDRYWRFIFAVAKRHGCLDQTAEEIVQDVMLEFFQDRDILVHDPSRGHFRAWLAKVTCNKIAEYYRRPDQRIRGRGGDCGDDVLERESHDGQPDKLWETVYEQVMLVALLDVVRREVAPQTYQAFELTAIRGLSGEQAATITGSAGMRSFLHERAFSSVCDSLEHHTAATANFTSAVKETCSHFRNIKSSGRWLLNWNRPCSHGRGFLDDE